MAKKKQKYNLPPFGLVDYIKEGDVHKFSLPKRRGKSKDIPFTATYLDGAVTISPVDVNQTFYVAVKASKKNKKSSK